MNAKHKDFIVLALGDIEAYGYDETALPLLLQLVDSSRPERRFFTPVSVVAYYLCCRRTVAIVAEAISRAEVLRESDRRFTTLGIGLGHGPLVAEFDRLGRLKPNSTPLGEGANQAITNMRDGQTYRQILDELRDKKH